MWSAVAIAVTGLVLILLGVVLRRRGKEPRCRKCDFELAGLATGAPCPECGADVSARRAVRFGRRRGPWLWMAGLVLVLVGIGVIGKRDLYDWGWEHRAPGWWLANVEVRFSTGARLNNAYMGLRFGVGGHLPGARSISQSSYDQACIVAFRRIASDANPSPAGLSRDLLSLAKDAADRQLVDEKQVASLIRRLVQVQPPGGRTFALYPSGQDISAAFMPKGWQVNFQFSCKDEKGNALQRGGHGTRSGRDSGSSFVFGDPHTAGSCNCEIELLHDATSFSERWSVTYQVPAS